MIVKKDLVIDGKKKEILFRTKGDCWELFIDKNLESTNRYFKQEDYVDYLSGPIDVTMNNIGNLNRPIEVLLIGDYSLSLITTYFDSRIKKNGVNVTVVNPIYWEMFLLLKKCAHVKESSFLNFVKKLESVKDEGKNKFISCSHLSDNSFYFLSYSFDQFYDLYHNSHQGLFDLVIVDLPLSELPSDRSFFDRLRSLCQLDYKIITTIDSSSIDESRFFYWFNRIGFDPIQDPVTQETFSMDCIPNFWEQNRSLYIIGGEKLIV